MYIYIYIYIYIYTQLEHHTSLNAIRERNCTWATSRGGSRLHPFVQVDLAGYSSQGGAVGGGCSGWGYYYIVK